MSIFEIFVLLVALVLYFVPSWIACVRNHPQKASLMIMNILFGWTAIGWGVAFVWSCWKYKEQQ